MSTITDIIQTTKLTNESHKSLNEVESITTCDYNKQHVITATSWSVLSLYQP